MQDILRNRKMPNVPRIPDTPEPETTQEPRTVLHKISYRIEWMSKQGEEGHVNHALQIDQPTVALIEAVNAAWQLTEGRYLSESDKKIAYKIFGEAGSS